MRAITERIAMLHARGIGTRRAPRARRWVACIVLITTFDINTCLRRRACRGVMSCTRSFGSRIATTTRMILVMVAAVVPDLGRELHSQGTG